MNDEILLKQAWGPEVEGEVLVFSEGFSPRYDLDRWTGVLSRIGHSLEGQSIVGKILMIPTVKGGVAGGWAFLDLLHKGIAPKALIFGRLNPVMVQGAVLASIPIAGGWDRDPSGFISTGDRIRFSPALKRVTRVAKTTEPNCSEAMAN